MMRYSLIFLLLCATAILVSCASSGSTSTPSNPTSIAGSWEFVASSSTTAATITGVEVALAEGTVQVNGINQPDGNISASGPNQITFVSLNTAPKVQFVANCPGTGPNSLTGTVSNLGGPVNFTFSENGNEFAVTAVLSTDGNTITGTYAPVAGNPCTDSGTILGTKIGKITGTFNGQFTLPDGTSPTVNGAATESSSGALTLTLTDTSTNTGFSLIGPVMGNAFAVRGTYQGTPSVYYGYYEVVKQPTLYMANADDPASPVYAGSLSTPPPP